MDHVVAIDDDDFLLSEKWVHRGFLVLGSISFHTIPYPTRYHMPDGGVKWYSNTSRDQIFG
jgi:hypothetical protein